MVLTVAIDEAARGPLIGSMVMAGVLVDEEDIESLKSIGVKDSKLLSQKKRVALFKKINSIVKKHKILVVSPKEIDAALESDDLNLNWLEAQTSAKIINALKPDKIIIDCPSNNVSAYKKYLLNLLDNKKVDAVVEHKADLNYVECAAASILAKVTREEEIEKIKKEAGDFGSGYMADPKTAKFLKENAEKHPDIFRKTWAPYKKMLAMKKQKKMDEF
ncbi:ribonuclease HII [Candidatus Woesearchaeota archaeon]|nr:ribonuclease HII [Candidatus Woesearchaeota archaeon]